MSAFFFFVILYVQNTNLVLKFAKFLKMYFNDNNKSKI